MELYYYTQCCLLLGKDRLIATRSGTLTKDHQLAFNTKCPRVGCALEHRGCSAGEIFKQPKYEDGNVTPASNSNHTRVEGNLEDPDTHGARDSDNPNEDNVTDKDAQRGARIDEILARVHEMDSDDSD
jgi:hypothetical protein